MSGDDRKSARGKFSRKIRFLAFSFPKLKVETIALFGLEVQTAQSTKSVCLPSEAITVFQQSFSCVCLAAYRLDINIFFS